MIAVSHNTINPRRSMIVPQAITRNRPRQESESKAPKSGIKLDPAFHKNIMIAAVEGSA
uniref:Uncharacterized protein n=1 Tax=Medicago truncatula TaxID=3880 RepID=I3S3R8_MEDTR|nr:unknown [Medicago truncatula]